jgi:hypothetical protein
MVLGRMPLPPDTGSNRAGEPWSQLGIAAGGALDGAGNGTADVGEEGALDGPLGGVAGRRVRNHADSSSRKIGSSIVSSGNRGAPAAAGAALTGGSTGNRRGISSGACVGRWSAG